jgi:hypothetical protein
MTHIFLIFIMNTGKTSASDPHIWIKTMLSPAFVPRIKQRSRVVMNGPQPRPGNRTPIRKIFRAQVSNYAGVSRSP